MAAKEERHAPRVHARAAARLKRIHEAISSGQYPNNRMLADLVERTERTVKRDLQYMRDQLGAPLHYERARRGWRYLEPGWNPSLAMTEGELLAFFTAEHALKMTGHTPEAALLRNALSKLAAQLPEEVLVNLSTLGEALSFQQTPHVVVDPLTLQTLSRAAAERRTISFDYYSQHRDEQTHREANILLLHNFAGDWYAIAYDYLRGEVRDFHVGRIKRIEPTSKFFDTPTGWDAGAYLRRGFFMMRGGRSIKVVLVFDPYQSRWMRERQTFHPEEQRENLPDGSMRLSFTVGRNGLEAVARLCLSYAGHCRAERPALLRTLICERLNRALEQHKED